MQCILSVILPHETKLDLNSFIEANLLTRRGEAGGLQEEELLGKKVLGNRDYRKNLITCKVFFWNSYNAAIEGIAPFQLVRFDAKIEQKKQYYYGGVRERAGTYCLPIYASGVPKVGRTRNSSAGVEVQQLIVLAERTPQKCGVVSFMPPTHSSCQTPFRHAHTPFAFNSRAKNSYKNVFFSLIFQQQQNKLRAR